VHSAFVSFDLGQIVAHVVPRHGGLSVPDLDAYLRDVVSHHPSTMVPHRYDVLAPVDGTVPPSPSTLASGGASGGSEGDNAAEVLIGDVFRACHAGRSVQLTESYAEAGGEFLRIPAMLDGIERAGYGGISWRDFVGFASMRTLAGKLTNGR
jgi:hypothetical protein